MDAETDLLERFLCIEIFSLLVIGHKFFFAELVKVLHDRKVRGLLYAIICGVGNSESRVQFGEQDFDGVDLRIGKILVAAEKVFQKGNVLTEPCDLFEGFGCVGVDILNAVRPCLGFKRIDGIFARHKINIAAAEGIAQILVLRFGIETDDSLARLTDIGENEFQKITFSLTAVAEDEDIACCLVLGPAVEVHKDVCAVLISPDI